MTLTLPLCGCSYYPALRAVDGTMSLMLLREKALEACDLSSHSPPQIQFFGCCVFRTFRTVLLKPHVH